MKTRNFVGLFQGKRKPGKIAKSLVIVGFQESDIITEETSDDVFLLSVSVRNKCELVNAKNIFEFYQAYNTYQFKFGIKDGEELRRLVDAHAKIQVYSTPEIRHNNHYHEGINSEVGFGN